MAHSLKLRKRAIQDLGEAYDWYEQQRTDLGEEFLLSTEDAFQVIQQNPELFTEMYPSIRKYNLRRFPYSVYYRIFKKSIAILAIYHQSRNPKRWQKRKSKT
jgi:plasmid stabilization system protein ParE